MSDFKHARFGPKEPPPEIPGRGTDPSLELLVHKIVGLESRIGDRVGLLLEDFKKELRLELHNEIRQLVPNGDVESHRKAHESMIASANRWAHFRYVIFEHVAKAAALGTTIYVALAIWEHFKRGVAG